MISGRKMPSPTRFTGSLQSSVRSTLNPGVSEAGSSRGFSDAAETLLLLPQPVKPASPAAATQAATTTEMPFLCRPIIVLLSPGRQRYTPGRIGGVSARLRYERLAPTTLRLRAPLGGRGTTPTKRIRELGADRGASDLADRRRVVHGLLGGLVDLFRSQELHRFELYRSLGIYRQADGRRCGVVG